VLALLLIAAFVLALVSLGTAWWSYSASAGGGTTSVNFLPGSEYNVTCAGAHCGGFSAGSFPYTALGGSLGSLYGTVMVLAAVSVALTGLVALFGALGAMGRRLGAWQRSGSLFLGLAAVILLLTALCWAVAAQPGAFPSGSSFTTSGSGSASPATSFWGSNAAGTISWGAGLGWYLALASVLLLCAVAILSVILGQKRLAIPERRARTVLSGAAPSVPVYSPPPAVPVVTRPDIASPLFTPPPTAPAPVTAPTAVPSIPEEPAATRACPICGTENLARSRTCSYCQRSLR
jgi:hypothetical protein